MKSQKWCSLTFKCFVLGLYLCIFAISIAPLLSSNTLQCIFTFAPIIRKPITFISFRRCIIGIASLRAYDKPVIDTNKFFQCTKSTFTVLCENIQSTNTNNETNQISQTLPHPLQKSISLFPFIPLIQFKNHKNRVLLHNSTLTSDAQYCQVFLTITFM